MFFFSQNIDFPFLFEGTLEAFLFLFFQYFSPFFFNVPSLWGLVDFDDKRAEKHSLKKISDEMEWNG
jgi:hypothetical protein